MIKYVNEKEIEQIIEQNEKLILVFGKGENCGVCLAVEDRINKMVEAKYPDLDVYYVKVDENPNFRGQHLIFAVPTIMAFDGNKEIHRESRIVDFQKLERLLDIYFN